MTIRVLGTTTVDGGALSPRDRTVLAALVVGLGRGLSIDELAAASWNDALPGTWQKQLQATISRLRRLIGHRSIITTATGYALAEGSDVDVIRFDQQLSAARLHVAAGEPDRAVEAYRRALALWRGTPYPELPDWPPARDAAARLDEQHHTAEEELQEAHLQCGEHRSVIAAAEQLVREAPYREARWQLLALANYRSGRQAEGLATLRAARRLLDDELAIEPGADLIELERAMLRQDPALQPARLAPRPSEDCPYRGLSAFELTDAAGFFGRTAAIAAASERLERTGFLALTGISGCGKSSIALAGVGAGFAERGWAVFVVRPSGGAIPALEAASNSAAAQTLIVVDQFEEVFQLADAERNRVCARIDDLVSRGFAVLITVRSDFIDRAATLSSLGSRIADHVQVVPAMSRDELREAIEAPARSAGLRLESGLTELLLRDAASAPGALPLVSHALVQTWMHREGSVLTVDGYESSGGIAGAIAQSADTLYEGLDAGGRRLCRDMMLRLVERGLDGQAVRRRLDAEAIAGDPARRDVIAQLTRARLVTAEGDALVITHEAIAAAWPQLHEWLEQDAGDARLMNHVATAAEDWVTHGEREDDLYRGARLVAAREWRARADPALTSAEARFLDAAEAHERREADATAERLTKDRRQNRRLRGSLVAASVLLVAAIVATGVAAVRGNDATAQAAAALAAEEDASIEALMSTSLALRGSQRDVAALLAAELWRRWPDDPRSRAALMGVVTASGGLISTRFVDADQLAGALIPGTTSAFLVTDWSSIEVHDIDTGDVTAMTTTPAEGFDISGRLALSRDGARAAVVLYRQADGGAPVLKLAVMDAATLAPIGISVELPAFPDAIAMDATGSLVVLAYDGGASVESIDIDLGVARFAAPLTDAGTMPELGEHASLAFAPDGRIALGTVHDGVLLLDPDTLAVDATVAVPEFSAHQAATMTADGVLVASGERSTTAVDTTTNRMLWTHVLEKTKPTACSRIAASSASGLVYCADEWGDTVEYDLGTGLPTSRRFDPQLGATAYIGLTARGGELLAIGEGTPSLSLWRTDGSGAANTLGAKGRVMLGGYGGPDQALVVAERPPDARYDIDLTDFSLWSPEGDRTVRDLDGELQGADWAGRDLLTAFSLTDDDFVAIVASTGERIEFDPVSDSSMRTWPSASGDRLYESNYTSGDAQTPARGWIGVRSGENLGILPLTFELGEGLPTAVSMNADDSLVAITRWIDGIATTGIFDGSTGDVIVDGLEGPTVTAITPSGELLAARDGRITRHDLRTLQRTGTLPGAHGEVNTLQVSRDGQTLLATANDETVSLYDLPSGIRLGDPIRASAPLIGQGALRPDGLEFVVNVKDGIQVWDADPAHQFEAACRIAGRELSTEERATYLATLPSSPPACAGILG